MISARWEEPDVAVVRFEVADTGTGIAGVGRARLFEPFVQADASTTAASAEPVWGWPSRPSWYQPQRPDAFPDNRLQVQIGKAARTRWQTGG